jgi:3-deoxy-D-manno-octulosonic acid kinase
MNRGGPPAGFDEIRARGVLVWVRAGFSALFDGAGSLRSTGEGSADGSAAAYRGRAEMLRIPLGSEGRPYGVVRHYRRGGMFEHLLRDGYLGRERFFREVRVTEEARARGVATVEVLAVRSQRVAPWVYRADLVTREIEGARDLQAYLESVAGGERAWAREDRNRTVTRVAGLVRRMHDAGLHHADLNLKNVLVRGEGQDLECFVIDLDKARMLDEPVGHRGRLENLLRLYRSLEKRGFARATVTLRDMVRFAGVYSAGDRTLMAAMKHWIRTPPLSLRMHRFFWRLAGGRA